MRLLALVLALAAPALAQANLAAVPKDRLNEAWWAQRHQDVLAQVAQHADAPLLLLGDSITQNYEKARLPDENFQPTWQTFYASRGALNLGFSGDTTANLLWRLDHGELAGLHPKAAVLLIGTNNTGVAKQNAVQTEAGIDAVIAHLERSLPSTRILLLGILPSDISPQKSATDAEVNRYLATLYSENPRVTYLDIGSIFSSARKLDTAIFYDPRLPGHPGALHPDTIGQRRMAEAIEPTLARLMGDQPRVPLNTMTDIDTAIIPVERLEQDSYDWYARHHAELAIAGTLNPRVVLIGDSITHFWSGPPIAARRSGELAWQQAFGDAPVLNMGFGWDRTQNVLWRLRQGEFDGLHPDFIVLNIGTNNLTGSPNARASTPSEVVEGIVEICRILHDKAPQSRILLMAIFPRGEAADNPLREPIRQVNRLLAEHFLADPAVKLIDLGPSVLTPDGTLPKTLMPDGTHPSEAGYAIWANALIQAMHLAP